MQTRETRHERQPLRQVSPVRRPFRPRIRAENGESLLRPAPDSAGRDIPGWVQPVQKPHHPVAGPLARPEAPARVPATVEASPRQPNRVSFGITSTATTTNDWGPGIEDKPIPRHMAESKSGLGTYEIRCRVASVSSTFSIIKHAV